MVRTVLLHATYPGSFQRLTFSEFSGTGFLKVDSGFKSLPILLAFGGMPFSVPKLCIRISGESSVIINQSLNASFRAGQGYVEYLRWNSAWRGGSRL